MDRLQYGFSYHLDPDIVTVAERDNALANMINEVQSWCYKTDLRAFAKMSSDEVLDKLEAIAENNSTDTVQITILENYYIFLASFMFVMMVLYTIKILAKIRKSKPKYIKKTAIICLAVMVVCLIASIVEPIV